MEKKYSHFIKILLLGEAKVGKTSLLVRYTDDKFFLNQMTTTGVDFKKKEISLPDNRLVCVQIWDTCGQDRYHSVTKQFFKGSNVIILVYCINSRESFSKVNQWLEKIDQNALPNVQRLLIANKSDLEEERQVSHEEGESLAKENYMNFYEVSASNNTNVNEAFMYVIEEYINLHPQDALSPKGKKLKKKNAGETYIQPKQKCCK